MIVFSFYSFINSMMFLKELSRWVTASVILVRAAMLREFLEKKQRHTVNFEYTYIFQQ